MYVFGLASDNNRTFGRLMLENNSFKNFKKNPVEKYFAKLSRIFLKHPSL